MFFIQFLLSNQFFPNLLQTFHIPFSQNSNHIIRRRRDFFSRGWGARIKEHFKTLFRKSHSAEIEPTANLYSLTGLKAYRNTLTRTPYLITLPNYSLS